MQNFLAVNRMQYFRMELNGIEFSFRIFTGRNRTVSCPCRCLKALCQLGDVIEVAHPADRFLRNVFKHFYVIVQAYFCFAIFSGGSLFHFTAQNMHH